MIDDQSDGPMCPRSTKMRREVLKHIFFVEALNRSYHGCHLTTSRKCYNESCEKVFGAETLQGDLVIRGVGPVQQQE